MPSLRVITRILLGAVLVVSSSPPFATAASQVQESTRSVTRTPALRVTGPNNEQVPVLNEGGRPLQLKVIKANGATVSASGWRSDSPDIATVTGSGEARAVNYGFATITAQTSQGEAKCFVAVVRVRSQTGGKVQGDTKTDTAGKVYLSDPVRHVIVRASGLTSERWVGSNNQPGFADGQGTTSKFDKPSGLSVDLSAQGGLYVADSMNHCIRKVGFDGRVGTANHGSVVVGEAETSGTMVGSSPFQLDGFRVNGPQGVVSVGGNLYVADTENHCIWYADVARGQVYLVGGKAGESGLVDGIGSATRFNRPSGLAINSRGTLLAVADSGNNVVRLIRIGRDERDQLEWRVSTLGVASSGKWRDVAKVAETDDLADAIPFAAPKSVSFDGVDNVYVIDDLTATVVTRPEEADPLPVALAESGSLGTAVSLTVTGTQALVLDGAAASEQQAVYEVTVGAPQVTSVTPDVTSLDGGETVVIEGSNFAPESQVTLGGEVVTEYEVKSARRIEFTVPAGITAPGVRTVTVATRGGLGQKALEVRAKRLVELNPGEITTVAGGIPFIGDGAGAASASLAYPSGVEIDASGNLYIADWINHRIRKVDATGRITTVAGTGEYGYNGDDKPATSTQLFGPEGVAVDASGNLYIADTQNNRVRRVDATGRITTVAGTGERGYDGDDKPAASAGLALPLDVAVDASGNLYIADTDNSRIRRVDATGRITTVAGTGEYGYDGDDKPATSAQLNGPSGVAVDALGNLYIADVGNNRIRRVDSAGRIATVAGTGVGGYDGDGIPAIDAQLNAPAGVGVDASGNFYIADEGNNRLRRVDASGRITTVAGSGPGGYDGDDKPATLARLYAPKGMALDASGNLYIADLLNHRIRRVDATGRITTVGGTGELGYDGDDKPATAARLNVPQGMAFDASGNLYIADLNNHRIRRVDTTGRITTVAGTGERGYDGDDKPAASARLNSPYAVAVDASGNLYIADFNNNRIRRVDSAGRITTVAGTGQLGYDGDGGPATSTKLAFPAGVAVDASGNLYIADVGNNRIRRVDATGRITTVAGTGEYGYDGDDKPATSARLAYPFGIAVDALGQLFIADTYNRRIRRVDTAGRITTEAGTGERGYDGDDGPATSARLDSPYGVSVDPSGNLYIADTFNSRIRRVDPAGRISTAAGTGELGYDGDDKPATSARLNSPYGVAVDASGDLYIGDTANNAIRAVRQPGAVGGGPTPAIERATFKESVGKLVLRGSGFGDSSAIVRVNGTDISSLIRKQTDTKVVLRGSRTDLGLHAGDNEVTVTSAGNTSAVFVLNL